MSRLALRPALRHAAIGKRQDAEAEPDQITLVTRFYSADPEEGFGIVAQGGGPVPTYHVAWGDGAEEDVAAVGDEGSWEAILLHSYATEEPHTVVVTGEMSGATYFLCEYGALDSVDLAALTGLDELHLEWCELPVFDTGSHAGLDGLYLPGCALESVDLSGMSALEGFSFAESPLAALILPTTPAQITQVYLSGTSLDDATLTALLALLVAQGTTDGQLEIGGYELTDDSGPLAETLVARGWTGDIPTYVRTLTLQPGEATTEDTEIWTGTSTPHGDLVILQIGESNLQVDSIYRGLLRFDLSGIPANAAILSAVLSLWSFARNASNNSTFEVFRMKRAWVEAQAIWTHYATGSAWSAPGGFGADDCEQTPMGSTVIDRLVYGEKQWALDAAAVQEWVSGAMPNNGVLIKSAAESDDLISFRSSSYDTDMTKRPMLAVSFAVP